MPDTKANQGDPQSPNVQEINYQKDVHGPSMEDIAAEMEEPTAAVEESKKEEVKTEEKKEETPAQPTKTPEEKPKEPEKPAIDEDKLTDSIANKLIDKMMPQDATKEEKKDIREKLKDLQDKAKADGHDLTYVDALEFLQKETKESVKAELKDEVKQEVLKDLATEVEEEEKKENEQRQETEKRNQEVYKTKASNWDNQLGELERAGKLLAFDDNARNNKESDAYKERMDFLNQMHAFNVDRVKQGLPEIENMVEFHTLYYKSPSEEPGKKAPVNGAKRGVGQSDDDFTYGSIHNTSLDDIVRGR